MLNNYAINKENPIDNHHPEPFFNWVNTLYPPMKNKNHMSGREKIILHYYALFFFSVSDLILKILPICYRTTNVFTMVFFQGLTWLPISYYDLKNNKEEIENWSQMKDKTLVIIRGMAVCAINIFVTLATYHIKYAIVISILFSNHIINSFFSYFYFKEKMHTRYIVGFVVSFGGLFILAINSSEEFGGDLGVEANGGLGVFFAVISSTLESTVIILNKILKSHKPSVLNFYSGISGILLALPFLPFVRTFELSLGYILLNAMNSFFYHLAYTFYNLSFLYNSLILVSSLNFSCIIFAFAYGFCFFGEMLNLMEFFGIGLIIGYNVYTTYYPLEEEKH